MTLPFAVPPGVPLGALRPALVEHGALLFRGWGIDSLADFAEFVTLFSGTDVPFGYAGGASPRKSLDEAGLYTSTEYPPDMTLALHNELSYAGAWPKTLFFHCVEAAPVGGETTLGDSRRILARIDAGVLDEFRRKGVRYVRNLSGAKGSGYGWQDAFETDDPAEAEAECRRIGADFEWGEDGFLRMSQVRPATAFHTVTGEEVWFNQADGFHPSALAPPVYEAMLAECGSEDRFRLNSTFGDGTLIPIEALEHIRAVLRAETVPHAWQPGDVIVLDNFLAAHGRAPFEGPRRIVLAMR
jgi:hypothetical protein